LLNKQLQNKPEIISISELLHTWHRANIHPSPFMKSKGKEDENVKKARRKEIKR